MAEAKIYCFFYKNEKFPLAFLSNLPVDFHFANNDDVIISICFFIHHFFFYCLFIYLRWNSHSITSALQRFSLKPSLVAGSRRDSDFPPPIYFFATIRQLDFWFRRRTAFIAQSQLKIVFKRNSGGEEVAWVWQWRDDMSKEREGAREGIFLVRYIILRGKKEGKSIQGK